MPPRSSVRKSTGQLSRTATAITHPGESAVMRSNDYYNLIVSSEEGHWDRGEGTTPKARFHYRSVEAVAARFPMSDAVEMTLKSFPAVFACEGK